MSPETENQTPLSQFDEVDPDEFGPVIAQRRRYVAALANGAGLAADQGDSGMVTALLGINENWVSGSAKTGFSG